MKKVKEYIKNMGWMLLPPTWIAYDKQKHGVLAIWLSVAPFFILSQNFTTSLIAAPIVFVFATAVAWGIEFYQKWFTTDRVFEVKDATIMMKVSAITLILLCLWQVHLGTFTM